MKVKNIQITNIDKLIEYYNYRTLMKHPTFGFKAKRILNRVKITLELEEITALELIFLRKNSTTISVTGSGPANKENIEERDLDENFLQAIKENNQFFDTIQKEEGKDYGFLFQTIMEREFAAVCVINSSILEEFDHSMDKAFEIEEKDKERGFKPDIDKIKNGFIEKFFQFFYRDMESSLNQNDQVIDKLMYDKYFSNAEQNSVIFAECTLPFEGVYGLGYEDDASMDKFNRATQLVKEYDLKDDVEMYFVCNTTFLTYFYLTMFHGLEADCNLSLELLNNNLYIDESLLNKYENRLNNYFGPVLMERTYDGPDRPIAMRVLTSTFNTTITYGLRIPLRDFHKLHKIQVSSHDDDYSKTKIELIKLGTIIENLFK